MSTRKKFWWAIGALAMTLVVAGASVGITLAAINAKVDSSFLISYRANNVSAAIFGAYGHDDTFTSMISGSDDKILFTSEESSADSAKQFDDLGSLNLTSDNPSVTLRYRLFNFKQNALPVSFTLSGNSENISTTYSMTTFDGTQSFSKNGIIHTDPITTNVTYSNYASYNDLNLKFNSDNLEKPVLGEDNYENCVILALTSGLQAAVDYYEENFDVSDNTKYGFNLLGWINSIIYHKYMQTKSFKQSIDFVANQCAELDSVINLNLNSEILPYAPTYLMNGILGGEMDSAIIVPQAYYFVYKDLSNPSLAEYFQSLPTQPIDFLNFNFSTFFDPVDSMQISDETLNLVLYTIYDLYLTNAYEAIDMAYLLVDDTNGGSFSSNENKAIIDALPEELEGYQADETTGKQQVEAKRAEYLEKIKADAAADENCTKYFAYMTNVLEKLDINTSPLDEKIIDSNEVPYTEISITFTIKDDIKNASFTNGKLEFVLGTV